MMGLRYHAKNLGINAIIGRRIDSASINGAKDLVVLITDKGPLYLTWVGECCAQCYLAHASNTEALLGVVTSAENAEWKDVKRDEDKYGVIESMGTTIKTNNGTITFESRLEHNGFYGGEILVSDAEPMDQYGSPREGWKDEKLAPLKDF